MRDNTTGLTVETAPCETCGLMACRVVGGDGYKDGWGHWAGPAGARPRHIPKIGENQ